MLPLVVKQCGDINLYELISYLYVFSNLLEEVIMNGVILLLTMSHLLPEHQFGVRS